MNALIDTAKEDRPEPTHKQWKDAMKWAVDDMKCREEQAKIDAKILMKTAETICNERMKLESIIHKSGLDK